MEIRREPALSWAPAHVNSVETDSSLRRDQAKSLTSGCMAATI